MKKLFALLLSGALALSLTACGGQVQAGAGRGEAAPDSTAVPETTATPEPTATPDPTAAPEPTATSEPTATPGNAPADAAETPDGSNQMAGDGGGSLDAAADIPGVSPEFKEVMDSYEAFFDEYAAFMEKYQSSNNSTALLMDYLSFLTRYTEAMQKLDEIDTDSLSDADLAYYTQVMLRISGKMVGMAGMMG